MVESSITPAMPRRIEIWPTDRLVPYAKNARTHSPEQVAQIAATLKDLVKRLPKGKARNRHQNGSERPEQNEE